MARRQMLAFDREHNPSATKAHFYFRWPKKRWKRQDLPISATHYQAEVSEGLLIAAVGIQEVLLVTAWKLVPKPGMAVNMVVNVMALKLIGKSLKGKSMF